MDNMNAVNLDTTRRMHVLWNAPLIIITNEEFHIYKIPEATEQGLCAIHELTLNAVSRRAMCVLYQYSSGTQIFMRCARKPKTNTNKYDVCQINQASVI